MIYAKLFKLSKLSNTEIVNRLNIQHVQRQQFEKSKKIDLTTIKELVSKHSINQNEVF